MVAAGYPYRIAAISIWPVGDPPVPDAWLPRSPPSQLLPPASRSLVGGRGASRSAAAMTALQTALAAVVRLARTRSARDSVTSFLIMGFGRALSLVLLLVLAAVMSIPEYGGFVYARNFILMVSPVLLIGMQSSLLRFVPAYLATGDLGKAKGYYYAAMALAMGNGVIAAALIAGLVDLKPDLIAEALRAPFLLGLLGLSAYAAIIVTIEASRSFGYVVVAYGPSHLAHPALMALIVLVVWLLTEEVTAMNVTLSLVLSYILVAALQMRLLVRKIPGFSAVSSVFEWSLWVRASAPLTMAAVAWAAIDRSPLFLLGLVRSAGEVGTYGLVLAFSQLQFIASDAVFGIALPRLSRALSLKRFPEAAQILRLARLAAGLATLGLGVALTAGIYAGVDLLLFGVKLPLDACILVFLGCVTIALAGPLSQLLIVLGKPREILALQAASLLVTVGSALLLIPSFGLVGAALSSLAGIVTRAVLAGAIIHFKHKVGF